MSLGASVRSIGHPSHRRAALREVHPPLPLDGASRELPYWGKSSASYDSAACVHAFGSNWVRVNTVSKSGIIGQAYGRKIHAREGVAIDEAGDGLCWVRLTRFGDD